MFLSETESDAWSRLVGICETLVAFATLLTFCFGILYPSSDSNLVNSFNKTAPIHTRCVCMNCLHHVYVHLWLPDFSVCPRMNTCKINSVINSNSVQIYGPRGPVSTVGVSCCWREYNSCMIFFYIESLLLSRPDLFPDFADLVLAMCPYCQFQSLFKLTL